MGAEVSRQSGGGSRPIKAIQDDLEKEKGETEIKQKLKDELAVAFERKEQINEELESLQTDLESVGVANDEENAKTSAKIAVLKAEFAALTEGVEEEPNDGDENIGNNSSSVKVQHNTNEGTEEDDLSPERCKEILKIPSKTDGGETTGDTLATQKKKTETDNLFASVYDSILGIFKSSYWAENDEDRCREILKEHTSHQLDEGQTNVENANAPKQPAQGGRRYTHKNRENRRRMRKQ